MLVVDYQVPRTSKLCASSGQVIAPGGAFYSVLLAEGEQFRRLDFAAEVWQGPPAGALAWWKTQLPASSGETAKRRAPNEVLWELFSALRLSGQRPEMLYVLTLLLLRRRILRAEGEDLQPDELLVYAPRDDETYTIAAVPLSSRQAHDLQSELDALLGTGPEGPATPNP